MRDKILKKLKEVEELPTISALFLEITKLLQSKTSSMAELSRAIHKDPSLASKVLKVANSACYGLRKKVASLQLALVVLGMKEIARIVSTISVLDTIKEFGGTKQKTFDIRFYWRHSVMTGCLATYLAKEVKENFKGECFVAGLLHDIGKIALLHFFPEDFIEIRKKAAEREINVYKEEKDYLGITHSEIGGWLAEKWSLPVHLITPILLHHEPDKAETSKILTGIVSFADEISLIYMDDTVETKDLGPLANSPAFAVLTGEGKTLDMAKIEADLPRIIREADEFMSVC